MNDLVVEVIPLPEIVVTLISEPNIVITLNTEAQTEVTGSSEPNLDLIVAVIPEPEIVLTVNTEPEIVLSLNKEPDIVLTLNTNPVAIKGDKGDEGLSAYDIAVNNGFVGSESDWLDSITGNRTTEEFIVLTPSITWTINHNKGYYPNVIVLDIFNRAVIAEVEYKSINQVIIYFSSEQAGKVLIS